MVIKAPEEKLGSVPAWQKKWLQSPTNREKIGRCFEPLNRQIVGYHNHSEVLRLAMELVAKERLGRAKNYGSELLQSAIDEHIEMDEFGLFGLNLCENMEAGGLPDINEPNLTKEEILLLMAEGDLYGYCRNHSPEPMVTREQQRETMSKTKVEMPEKSIRVDVKTIPKELVSEVIREVCLMLVADPEVSGHGNDLASIEEFILRKLEGVDSSERDKYLLAVVQLARKNRDELVVVHKAEAFGAIIASKNIPENRQKESFKFSEKINSFQKEFFYIN
jgi:hypothetical protein